MPPNRSRCPPSSSRTGPHYPDERPLPALSRRSQVVRLRGAFAPFRPTPRAHRKVSREVGEGTLGLCQHTEATALVLKGPLSRRLSKPARAVAKEGFEQNNAPNSMVILVIIFLTI